jgi:hypothetical protein
VFRDDTGQLGDIRRRLAWYPHEIRLWMIACQWQRISQEEAFVGRCAEAGDDLGSRVVAGRLVRDVMSMCFLQERRYAPYSKWFGTAFSRLDAASELGDPLRRALAAHDYPHREAALVAAYEALARRHNALGITAEVDPSARPYYGRPYRVLHSERFVSACLTRLAGTSWAQRRLTGGVDQFVDSTDVLSHGQASRALAAAVGSWAAPPVTSP